jgi:isopentenyldiphosphate isomerase
MDELIDYVDDNDQVIGKIKLSEAKEKKLNYRISHIWIINDKRELLICKRPPTTTSYAGKWTSTAGGHVDTEEIYQTAAEREAKEELGINLKLKRAFKIKFKYSDNAYRFIDLWYCLDFKDINKINFDKEEISEHNFISFKELMEKMDQNHNIFNPELIQLTKTWISDKNLN